MAIPRGFAFLFIFSLFLVTTSCWHDHSGRCNSRDVRIYQSPSGFTSLHIPKFAVQIINEGWDMNVVFDVKISCGEFASANLVNPMIFRRIIHGSCVVKDGKKIYPGEVISFEYSNIFPYHFSVLELKC
nr:TPD1 protein homolog 1B-like [Coffea arabica]